MSFNLQDILSHKNKLLLLFFILVNVLFVSVVLFNQRGYQDSWILEDILVPTVIYILIMVSLMALTDDARFLVFFASSFVVALNAIPNLKYTMMYGTFDSIAHLGNVNDLLASGHISNYGYYGITYYDFPGLHIFLGSVSLILGIDVDTTFRLISSIIFGCIPLFTYFITNRLFDKTNQKHIIIASSLPLVTSYILVGATFGMALLFLFICLFFKSQLSQTLKREFGLLSIVVIIALLFSHTVTILTLSVALLAMLGALSVIKLLKKEYYGKIGSGSLGFVAVVLLIVFAWFSLKADSLFRILVTQLEIPFTGQANVSSIPSSFYAISFVDQLKILILYHIKDAVLLYLSIVGFLLVLTIFRKRKVVLFKEFYLPLSCIISVFIAIVGLELVSNVGGVSYIRFLYYALLFTPFFIGIFFSRVLEFKIFRKWMRPFVLIIIVCSTFYLSIPQVFPYQPMAPTADSVSSTLQNGSYILEFRLLNTIYQKSMISFAARFSPTDQYIVADTTSRWQTYGFASANASFYERVLYDSPLENNDMLSKSQWGLFLLHDESKAATFNEAVGHRTPEIIENIRENLGNVIYDNGHSFIISRLGK